MGMNSFKILDGYVLNTADGYSTNSAWVDLQSAKWFSVSTVFSGGTPAGTLKLQQSNDLQSTRTGLANTNSGLGASGPFPESALQPYGDPLDVADVPAPSTSASTGSVTATISAAGVTVFNQYEVGYRWVRLVYTASSDHVATMDAFVTVKW